MAPNKDAPKTLVIKLPFSGTKENHISDPVKASNPKIKFNLYPNFAMSLPVTPTIKTIMAKVIGSKARPEAKAE